MVYIMNNLPSTCPRDTQIYSWATNGVGFYTSFIHIQIHARTHTHIHKHTEDLFVSLYKGTPQFYIEGNGNPLQYSCLENPMDGGAR